MGEGAYAPRSRGITTHPPSRISHGSGKYYMLIIFILLVRIISVPATALFRLHVGRADHLAPLFGFGHQQLAEFGCRHRERDIAEVGQPRVDFRIGEARPDLAVEHLDDFGGRAAWRADAGPSARLVARQEFADGRHVRQCICPHRWAYTECPQSAGPDVL